MCIFAFLFRILQGCVFSFLDQEGLLCRIGVSLDRGQKAREKTRAGEQRANEEEGGLSSTMDIVWGVSR